MQDAWPHPPVAPARPVAGSALDDALARVVAHGRTDEAASARTRGRWLAAQDAEEATLAAVLVDLGQRGASALVGVAGRRPVAGTIVAVGSDVVALTPIGQGSTSGRASAGRMSIRDPSAGGSVARPRPSGDADGDGRAEVLIALAAVDWVRANAGDGALPVGGRSIEAAVSLAALLVELAADRADVAVSTRGGEHLPGVLRAVGRNVLRLDLDGGGAAVVPLPAVVEVLISAR